MEQEKNKINKKILIICSVVIIVIIASLIGIMLSKNETPNTTDENNSIIEENTSKDEFSALEDDIEKAISEKNLIKATSSYTILKLTADNGGKVNNERYTKITNDLQSLKDERKAELLTKVDVAYDDMTLQTSYTVKGAKTLFDEDLHLMPVLKYDETNKIAIFGTQFGIVQDDWIFFDSLIINIDGDVTNISRNSFDKYTEAIGGGYIFEYSVLYLQKYPLFNALVEKMINGNEIKIRFVGKPEKGNADHIITVSEKENLAILYELSLCL